MTDKTNIIQFPADSREDIWECECGCLAFYIGYGADKAWCVECDAMWVMEPEDLDEGA
jgi:hypothetical protein